MTTDLLHDIFRLALKVALGLRGGIVLIISSRYVNDANEFSYYTRPIDCIRRDTDGATSFSYFSQGTIIFGRDRLEIDGAQPDLIMEVL